MRPTEMCEGCDWSNGEECMCGFFSEKDMEEYDLKRLIMKCKDITENVR